MDSPCRGCEHEGESKYVCAPECELLDAYQCSLIPQREPLTKGIDPTDEYKVRKNDGSKPKRIVPE
jgi:hypothetical protein